MEYSKQDIDYIRLWRSKNVGPRTFWALMQWCNNDPTRAIEMAPSLAKRGGRKHLSIATEESVYQEIDALEKMGGTLLLAKDTAFPYVLKHIDDCPAVLTVLGDTHCLNSQTMLAVVGSRHASANGCQLANQLSRELVGNNIVIASGLARGIDSAAHQGALLGKGKTVAVIASGVDTIYPPENKTLFGQIAEHGAVISEFALGVTPRSQFFPRRNRIISGLSMATLVVEANLRSGSLITANFALEQGRDVFAIPGSPLDPRCAGPNKLIQDGARLVASANDIIEHLSPIDSIRTTTLNEPESDNQFTAKKIEEDDISDKQRQHILQMLGASPVQIETLIEQSNYSHHKIVTILLELELAGIVLRQPGNRVVRFFQTDDIIS